MGKKATKSDQNKHQVIKIMLRPKVYITDSSTFKKLVQELTGDGGKIKTSPYLDTKPLQIAEPTLSVEDYTVDYSETSMEASADSFQSYNPMLLYTDDHDLADVASTRQQVDLQGYRAIESWLLDMEQFDQNCYNPIVQDQYFSSYDHELSQLL